MKTQMILLVMNFCIVAIATEVYKFAGSALRHNVSPILKDTQQPVPYMPPIRTTVLPSHEPKPLPRKLPWNPPALHPTMPKVAPSRLSAPAPHKSRRPSNNASAPFELFPKPPGKKRVDGPAYPPSVSFFKHHHAKGRASNIAPSPSYYLSPRTSDHQGPVILRAPSPTPTVLPKKGRQKYHGPSPLNQGHVSPIQSPFPSTESPASAAPFLYPTLQGGQSESPVIPPNISPSMPSLRKPKAPVPSPVRALPPPPPNQDCTSVTCIEPLTNTPPESHCGCVWPLQVGLRVNVALYTFFPLVSELANEIAAGVFLKKSQVRIMGANAASEKQDKTLVLIDLVPLGEKFDNTTAFLTYQKFWHKQVNIKTDFFGDYEVLYVRYPGLPPSPPLAPSSITAIDGEPYTSRGSNGRTIKPLGVDIRRRQKDGIRHSMIGIIIVLASSITVFLCIGAACLVLLKHRNHAHNPTPTPQALRPSFAKLSGATGLKMFGSDRSFASLSFGSSIATYTISSKTFNAGEIERATDNFNDSRILGEGGFGRVYSANLDDGTKVAVKVLKRDDHQGDREFVAEVEMLSRLHHKNLVKLIGICTEDNTRCLVYELVPNGSVESHLHGLDKKTSPLDWAARMKIALGAARGLAYLHEDSSPCVIHRDFKSSNILLEHDFTPKVSDFGLARTALDEGNKHISTRVMGTFGYVAPEYAMTGHLLVKSDVYSYGVVLLELLTGRKPVDMTQPQGQENLVSWARPLLATTDGLETIIDPSLGPHFPFNNAVKVAAIASMCVQPEVAHRPFMGEVVQALKLVYSEFDETKEAQSGGFSQEDWSIDMDARISIESGMHSGNSHTHFTNRRALSPSDISNVSTGLWREESDSFRRHSTSGPLQTGSGQFWQRLKGLSRGSISEHGVALRLWAGRR